MKNETIKNIILSIICAIFAVIALCGESWAEVQVPDGIYPSVGIVANIDGYEVIVILPDGNDMMYYDDNPDLLKSGDLIALLMFDEYTTPDDVTDDIIINAIKITFN